jgi:Tol biopolymer transport system component/serine/threonine protein kinase
MGEVYRARDPRLGRDVAIKVLPEDSTEDPERRRRFELEARAVGALSHPNLLSVFDIGHHEGAPFVVFELLEGETLRVRLGQGALPPAKAVDYAIQMARGLCAAHEKGIVHRDLKPDNLFLTRDGPLKILDFGLAKLRWPLDSGGVGTDTPTASVHTGAQAILGTVGYMSPEQVRRSAADHRSDIFSFGLVLYEMLTGRRAFRGETEAETLTAILNQDLPPLGEAAAGASPVLERILKRCVEKRPQDRFQSTRDLVFNLEAALEGGSGPSSGASGAPSSTPPSRLDRPRSLVGAAVAVAVVLGLLAVAVRSWMAREAENPAGMAPLRVAPLTSLSGGETNPALSPDGSQVAFSWEGDFGGAGDIYVQLIGAGTPLRLTRDPADDQSPAWSPDGRHVAFIRCGDNDAGIYTVPALGGAERRLQAIRCSPVAWAKETGRSLDWSADGKLLAFADQVTPDSSSVFLLSIETLEKRRLTVPSTEHQSDSQPAFSPDGRQVAFARAGGQTRPSLLVVPTAGGEPRRLGSPDEWTSDQPLGLAWTPDGLSLVAAWRGGTWLTGAGSLWRVPVGGGASVPLPFGGNDASQPSISPRGNRLAFVETKPIDIDIWEVGIVGSPPTGRPPRKILSSSRMDSGQQYSPDGRKIAFESDRSGASEIWISDGDGANALQMTRLGTAGGTPRWSPDGRRLAFDSVKEGQFDVYLLDVAGGAPSRLTPEASWDAVPSWSGDGRFVYFGSNRSGTFEVWKMPSAGGPAVQVTRHGGYAAFEAPGGRLLYYAKYNAPGIFCVPVDGGEERPVLERLPVGYWGYWGIGRRGLYYIDPEARPRPVLELFDLSTRRVSRIAELEKPPPQWTSGFAVSPDEKRILYTQWEPTGSDIMLVEGYR